MTEGEGERERERGGGRERCVINILTECVDIKVCYDTENKVLKSGLAGTHCDVP